MALADILTLIVGILICIILILGFVYWYMSFKDKSKNKNTETTNKNKTSEKSNVSQYTKLSVYDFMQFDKIEDNMIVQDNGEKYLMVVECEGINYDLMSGVEKASVEAGFVQFLNTLRYPIQIYTQTRTLKISNSIENYRRRIEEIKVELESKQKEYNMLIQNNTYTQKQLQDARLELARIQNMYDYGVDVVDNIEQMSNNKNVLRKYYYIIIPYYKAEIGSDLLDEDEKRSMIFSELYTRAQATIRTLFACSMKCRVLDSSELAELLYVAYNRDDSEVFGIEKALKSGYEELYSTAPDVLDKKMNEINKEIEEKALKLAIDTVNQIKTEKQKRIEKKEKNFDELVKEMAEALIKENKQYVGEDIVDDAINQIRNEKTKEEDEANEEKTKKRARKSTKSA